ncbi:hypothetical protein PsAD2_04129 [Pseudovibrio axinellae]|uniref:Uncharacterized protein n=1 Tax=Pseudovibrio axinellae TaxID=989403 RepID=A0A165TY99_9HYPH|nr:hypothetical protein [Pseudovibrio axinellae]KZL08460.1 hypothetical protein PsAD2_04129 [Pseudovibrio axinellae]SEP74622.1 hypothetical protein SAMN05421798_101295 [Pseudovibrio axinellae]
MSTKTILKNTDLPAKSEDVLRETLIANAMKPIAAELRLCDLSSLARHILSSEAANLTDLLASSSELYFKPDTLTYAGTSSIDLNWNGNVTVCLHMKFAHNGVNVIFHLFLLALNSAIDVKFIAFDQPSQDPQENTKRLETALTEARIAS